MCQNANKTAASLMAAIEPTLKSLLTFAGVDPTVSATVFSEYDTALAAIKAWAPGTAAQDILELLTAFDAAFNALPVPSTLKDLANIILAGISTVIGVITANSPQPVAVSDSSPAFDFVGDYQAHVAIETASKVQTLVPGFKRSLFHSPESQYKTAWNSAVDEHSLPTELRVA